VLPKDIIEGNLRLPIFDYQYMPYAGGNAVVSLLALIPFLLFGQSLISLKLVSLCFFSLGTMIAWYLFLCRYFNIYTGLIFGLLYVLSPPFFSKMNLIAWGRHDESNFFSIIIIYLLYKLIYTTNEFDSGAEQGKQFKQRPFQTLIFFGIVSGFGIYFSYMCLITVLVSLLLWLFSDRMFFLRKDFAIYLVGFFVGFLPWMTYNIMYNLSGFCNFITGAYMDDIFTKEKYIISFGYPDTLWGFVLKFFKLIFYYLPGSFGFQSSIKNIIYFLFLLFCLILIFLKSIKYGFYCKENIFLIYPLAFFLFFTFSGFYINENINPIFGINDYQAKSFFHLYKYRYFSPLYPFLFSIIAILIGRLLPEIKSLGLKSFSIACVIFLLGLGMLSNLRLIDFSSLWNQPALISLGKGLVYKGYDYYITLPRIVDRDVGDKRKLVLMSTIEDEYRPRTYEILGIKLGKEFNRNFNRITTIERGIQNSYKYHFYWGVGYGSAEATMGSNNELERVIGSINRIEFTLYKAFCYEGFGFKTAFFSFAQWIYSPESKEKMKEGVRSYLEIINSVPAEFKPFCFIGLGKLIGENQDSLKPIHYEELIDYFNPEYIRFIELIDYFNPEYIYIGFGKEIGEIFRNEMVKLFKPHRIKTGLRSFYFKRLEEVTFDCKSIIKELEPPQRLFAYLGIGLTVQKYFNEPYLLDFISAHIDRAYREHFLKGTNGFAKVYSEMLEKERSSAISPLATRY